MIDVNVSCVQAASAAEDETKWNIPKWFALYTKSRHEKLVERELTKKGIETFLPKRKVTHHWTDRRKIVEEPLFKSYIFVRAPLVSRIPILNTTGVVRFVGKRPSEPVEIPQQELNAVKRFIEEEIFIDPFPYLKEGQRVYIRSGPLKGIEGFVLRKDKHCRLVISLDMLMQSVSVQVDEACIEPL